jgi:hypothetical protein
VEQFDFVNQPLQSLHLEILGQLTQCDLNATKMVSGWAPYGGKACLNFLDILAE